MIKSRFNTDNGPMLVMGLSHMNLDRLKEGKPIHFRLEQFGMEGEVLLFAGESESSMIEELRGAGWLTPKTAETMLRAIAEDTQERAARGDQVP